MGRTESDRQRTKRMNNAHERNERVTRAHKTCLLAENMHICSSNIPRFTVLAKAWKL